MKGAGYYSDRLMWRLHSSATQTADGAVPETFTNQRYLKGKFENPRGADKIMWGSLNAAVDTMFRFRGNPGVRTVDRLRASDGTDYMILGIALDADGDDQVAALVGLPEGAP